MRSSASPTPARWCWRAATIRSRSSSSSIVYAKPPQAVFCREDSGFKQPKDLEGASIANPAGGATVDMFPVYAKAAGFDASKVKWIVAGSDALPGLLAGNRVPCVGQFTVGDRCCACRRRRRSSCVSLSPMPA